MLLLLWTTAGRALSATWTAPPPMIAPPHVQAHNLASAIRTDIGSTLFCLPPKVLAPDWSRLGLREFPLRTNAKETVNCNLVNSESVAEVERITRLCSIDMVNVPLWHDACCSG
jgi:hypothetical protein